MFRLFKKKDEYTNAKVKKEKKGGKVKLLIGILVPVLGISVATKDKTEKPNPIYIPTTRIENTVDKIPTTEVTTYEYTSVYQQNQTTENNNDILNEINVSLNDTSKLLFDDYLSKVDVDYKYDDLFGIDEALAKLAEEDLETNKKHTHQIALTEEGLFDADIIMEAVKKNNKLYLESDSISAYKKAAFSEVSNTDLSNICRELAISLNYEIQNNNEIDIDELRCVVGNLKIFSAPSTSNAYVNHDDCLVISPNMIKTTAIIKDNAQVQDYIIKHESRHLIQKACSDVYFGSESEKKIVGINVEWDDLEVNALNWQWFFEASAEERMMDETGEGPITYEYLISYLDSLTMATILDKNVESNQTEKLCFQNNIEKLFEQFGCKDLEARREIIKMMYSIDVIQYSRDDFYNKYSLAFNEDKTEETIVKVQRELKVPVCLTLTKVFYSNLAKYLAENELTLNDVFYLIRVFEGDVNSHLDCANDLKLLNNKEFMKIYTDIQNEFFSELAESNNFTNNAIIEYFNNYKIPKDNQVIMGIENSKKEFISSRYQEVKYRATSSISNINATKIEQITKQK